MVQNNKVGQIERKTQDRLINLFQNNLNYTYLGNYETRPNNSNVEEDYLRKFLKENKYSDHQITRTIHEINKIIGDKKRDLYDTNKEF